MLVILFRFDPILGFITYVKRFHVEQAQSVHDDHKWPYQAWFYSF